MRRLSAKRGAERFGQGWRRAERAAAALVLVFLVAPIVAIVPLSFNDGTFLHYPLQGVSLRWYRAVLSSAQWGHALTNSLIVGACATALATVLGTLAALGTDRIRARWVPVLAGILIAPMIVPVIITALGLYLFLAALGLTATYLGLILGHTLLAVPFVFITVVAALKNLDRDLPRAAATLGSGPVRTFLTVTLPLTLPGIVSGALLAFATSFDEVVLTLFVAGPAQRTLPRQIFDGIRESINPSILALATMLIAFAALLLTGAELVRRR